jgi:phage terminase large subunit
MTTLNLNKPKQIRIKAEVFNDVYLQEGILEDESRYLLLYGGAGSGKSIMAVFKVLYRILSERQKHKFLVLRKVARTIRNSVFSAFVSVIHDWGLQDLCTISKTDFTITFENGSSIIFSGVDDVEKLRSIHGVTGVFCDEFTDFTKQDFLQIDIRLRGQTKYYKQLILCFNPISIEHWIYKHWFEQEQPNTRILKTTYKDNKFLDEQYKQVLEDLRLTDRMYYNVYCLGEFGIMKGAIFTNYVVDDTISRNPDDYPMVVRGVDFGYNDPSVFLAVGVDEKQKKLYIFREIYETQLTNDQLIEKISKYTRKKDRLTMDSAEPARIESFRKAGFFNAKAARKGKGSIRSGIDKIKQYQLYIHPDCHNAVRELSNYKWAENPDGTLRDEPAPINDHCCDALRYAVDVLRGGRKLKAGLSLY